MPHIKRFVTSNYIEIFFPKPINLNQLIGFALFLDAYIPERPVIAGVRNNFKAKKQVRLT